MLRFPRLQLARLFAQVLAQLVMQLVVQLQAGLLLLWLRLRTAPVSTRVSTWIDDDADSWIGVACTHGALQVLSSPRTLVFTRPRRSLPRHG